MPANATNDANPDDLRRWRELQILREKTKALRDRDYNVRNRMFAKQRAIVDLETEDLKQRPTISSSSSSRPTLRQLQDDCNTLRDEWNRISQQLLVKESRLQRLEKPLYKQLGRLIGSVDLLSLDERAEFDTDSSDDEAITEPDYFSRLGDLHMVREQYEDLMEEHARVLDLQAVRSKMGAGLGSEDRSFLDEFPYEQRELLQSLTEIQQDLDRLEPRDVIPLSNPSASLSEVEDDDDDDLLQVPVESKFETHPILLPNPVATDLDVLVTDFLEGDSADRIDKWLLHMLHNSTWEVAVMFFLQPDTAQLNEQGQLDVVCQWLTRDEATEGNDPRVHRATGVLTASSGIMERGQQADSDRGRANENVLLRRRHSF